MPAIAANVTVLELARMIDHSLLHPAMTDAQIRDGLATARGWSCATACVKPWPCRWGSQVQILNGWQGDGSCVHWFEETRIPRMGTKSRFIGTGSWLGNPTDFVGELMNGLIPPRALSFRVFGVFRGNLLRVVPAKLAGGN